MFRMSDGKHFQEANRQLYYKMNNDPSYRASLEEKFREYLKRFRQVSVARS
jgi:hypothetical protein